MNCFFSSIKTLAVTGTFPRDEEVSDKLGRFPPPGPGSKSHSGDIILPLKKSPLEGLDFFKDTVTFGVGPAALNISD